MISLGLFATQLQGLLWIAKNANQLSLSRLVVSTSHGPWYASRGAFAIVPWDNSSSKPLIDWLGRVSVTGRTQDAGSKFVTAARPMWRSASMGHYDGPAPSVQRGSLIRNDAPP
jgi:hypothetical protein